MEYTIHVTDGNSLESTVLYNHNFCKTDISICPKRACLFHNDVFAIRRCVANTHIDISDVVVKHSSVRANTNIPAILFLCENKTYGRSTNGKKLMYKCVPDDSRLPEFIVPYNINMNGFSKNIANMYVTIRFLEWTSMQRPMGQLTQVLGPVTCLHSFYGYQLYCKSLNASIKTFESHVKLSMSDVGNDYGCILNKITQSYGGTIHYRTNPDIWKIFTIDPLNCGDLDDAMSVQPGASEDSIVISVYISNVFMWLEGLNLWDSFANRIATIYLPDQKRPMLPTQLSERLCSLKERANKFVICVDITICTHSFDIVNISYQNAIAHISKNYVYESSELLNDQEYLKIFDVLRQVSLRNKRITGNMTNVKDSHDVVCYLMILVNTACAGAMADVHHGIFRTSHAPVSKHGPHIGNSNNVVLNATPTNNGVSSQLNTNTCGSELISCDESAIDSNGDCIPPHAVLNFIHNWKHVNCQYIDISALSCDDMFGSIQHHTMNVGAYIHMTSPIRRLIDVLNLIQFHKHRLHVNVSESAMTFYSKWTSQMEYLNIAYRSIRKLQTTCELLDMFSKQPGILDLIYEGYCFDKIHRCDGLIQYMVYLPKLKIVIRMSTTEDMPPYASRSYRLYLFKNEHKFTKKIRIKLLAP